MKNIDIDILTRAVRGGVCAIRTLTRMQPVAGPRTPVHPPTYLGNTNQKTYVTWNSHESQEVSLDSVASQANRFESALRRAVDRGRIEIPIIEVDMSSLDGLVDCIEYSILDVPHRAFDAIFRDCTLDGVPFRESAVGQAIVGSRPRRATGIYRYAPTCLVFGAWDSTGLTGRHGAKYARAITSRVIGYGALPTMDSGGRTDPLDIRASVTVYESQTGGWTTDPDAAARDKKKPRQWKNSKTARPSMINHGAIAPSVITDTGGVITDHAVQMTAIHLGLIRSSLSFPTRYDGSVVAREERDRVDTAARTCIAALALAAVALAREDGYDLRSGASFVPEESAACEFLHSDGSHEVYDLDVDGALELLQQASTAAADLGLPWDPEPVVLAPTPELVDLIRRSRDVTESE